MKNKNTLILKRAFDIIGAFIGLSLLSPLMGIIAIAIKLNSPGPVLYRQNRLGQNGQIFRIIKFRSMIVGAEWTGIGLNVLENDPRITCVGRTLRRFSLDEIPQLFNVLKGEMSLVGPRPGLPSHLDLYSECEIRRLSVKPGLTGLAQVRGRAALSWPERIKYDLEYIEKHSFLFDFNIILQTLRVLISSDGVYNPKGGGWTHSSETMGMLCSKGGRNE